MQPGTYPRNKRYAAALPRGERGANDNSSSDSLDATAIALCSLFAIMLPVGAIVFVVCLVKNGWL